MRKFFILFCLSALTFAVSAQQVIKSEGITDFNKVNFTGKMTVELIASDRSGVSIELNGVDQKRLSWGVSADELSVKVRPVAMNDNGTVKVQVFYKHLSKITASGADIRLLNIFVENIITVDLSGGSKLLAKVDCKDLNVTAIGNSAVEISGITKYYTLYASQNTKVVCGELEAMSVTAEAYLSAEVYVKANERFVGHTSTGSSIFYYGKPEIVHVTTKLGGGIYPIDSK